MSKEFPTSHLPLLTPVLGQFFGNTPIPIKLLETYNINDFKHLEDLVGVILLDIPEPARKPLFDYIFRLITSKKTSLLYDYSIPITETDLTFGSLFSELSVRTSNALFEAGYANSDYLSDVSLNTLVNTPGLGIVGLLELLANIYYFEINDRSLSERINNYTNFITINDSLTENVDFAIYEELNKAAGLLKNKDWASQLFQGDIRLRSQLDTLKPGFFKYSLGQIAESFIDEPMRKEDARNKCQKIYQIIEVVDKFTQITLQQEMVQIIEAIGSKSTHRTGGSQKIRR